MDWTVKKSRRAIRTILEYGRPYQTWMVRGMLGTVCVVLFRLAMPWPLRGIIELVTGQVDTGSLLSKLPEAGDPILWLCGSFVFVAFGLGLSELKQRIYLKTYSGYTVRDLRSQALRSAVRSKTESSRQASGDVIARLVGDSARIRAALSSFLIQTSQSGLLFVGITAIVLYFSPKLGAFFLVGGVVAIFIMYRTSFQVAKLSATQRKREGALANQIQWSLEYGELDSDAEETNAVSTEKDLKTSRLIGRSVLYVHVIFASITAAALMIAVSDVRSGTLRVGELFIFMAYVLTVHRRLIQLGRQLARGGKMLANVRRIRQLIDAAAEQSDPKVIERIQSEIRLEGVRLDSARNSDGRPRRLEKVNMKIRAGTRVAVIGAAGSGKSALLRLIAGIESPDKGKLVWDGDDLTESGDVRVSCVAYMPQSPTFPATRLWRILGTPDASGLNRVQERSLRRFGGWKLLQTSPKGLREKIASTSMTQNEARALSLFSASYGNRPVLVLDAPTEGLQKSAALRRLKEILRVSKHRTLIMSTTQPLKVSRFDQVVVLKRGKIAFEGTPVAWKSWKRKEEELKTAVVGKQAS